MRKNVGTLPDYYGVLGVPRTASAEEVRKLYRFLAKSVHPDRFSKAEEKARAAEHFKRINEAHRVLSDPRRRREYDARLAQASMTDAEDIPGARAEDVSGPLTVLRLAVGGLEAWLEYQKLIRSRRPPVDPYRFFEQLQAIEKILKKRGTSRGRRRPRRKR